MSLAPYTPVTRVPKDKITLTNLPFSKWLSKRNGASAGAIAAALTLITNGLKEAMAEGYAVRLVNLGTFETRELGPRKRYHRLEKKMYISPPNVVVHFKKSELLTSSVRRMAQARLDAMTTTPSVQRMVSK